MQFERGLVTRRGEQLRKEKGKESQKPACRSEPGQEKDRVWGEIMNRYPTDVLFHGFTTSGPAQSGSAGEGEEKKEEKGGKNTRKVEKTLRLLDFIMGRPKNRETDQGILPDIHPHKKINKLVFKNIYRSGINILLR